MMALSSTSLRVVLVDSYNFCAFCRLPARYAKEINGVYAPKILQLCKDADVSGPESLIVAWTGAVSKEYPEAIELSRAYVEHLSAQQSIAKGHLSVFETEGVMDPWDYYTVKLLDIEEAIELELTPVDVSAWRLVSAQAGLIESVLLRQTCVATLGDTLDISLSLSVFVRLRVSRLVVGQNHTQNIDAKLTGVLSPRTNVSVVPISEAEEDREREQSRQAQVSAKLHDQEADVSPAVQIEEMIKHARTASTKCLLRVLPVTCRSSNCLSELAVNAVSQVDSPTIGPAMSPPRTAPNSPFRSSRTAAAATPAESEALLDALLEADEGMKTIPDVPSSSRPKPSAGSCLPAFDACISSVQEQCSDIVRVHPSYFRLLLHAVLPSELQAKAVPLELAAGSDAALPKDIRRKGTSLIESAWQAMLARGYALAVVQSSASTSLPESFTRSLTVKVCPDKNVRCGHVYLPYGIRFALGLGDAQQWDFSHVTLSLLSSATPYRRISNRVILSPICKNNSLERRQLPVNPDQRTTSAEIDEKIDIEVIKLAVLRWREREVHADVVLAHGDVLQLSFRSGKKEYLVTLPELSEPSDGDVSNANAENSFVLLPAEDDDALLACLGHLRLGPVTPAGTPPATPSIYHDLFAHNVHSSSIREILELSLAALLPHAILDRLACRAARAPATHMLVTGAVGSGCTTVVQRVATLLRNAPAVLAYTEFVDCAALVRSHAGKPLRTLLSAIEGHVQAARQRAPAVLFLDRLDLLAPTTLASADPNSGSGNGMYSEKAGLLSLQWERLLDLLHHGVQRQWASLRSASVSPSSDEQSFCVHACLSCTVVVVATAHAADDLAPRVRNRFAHNVRLPPSPSPTARLHLLQKVLQRYGCPLQDASYLGSAAEMRLSRLAEVSEGMRASELVLAARRAIAQSAVSVCSARLSSPTDEASLNVDIQCTWESLEQALKDAATSPDSASLSSIGWAAIGGLQHAKRRILDLLRAPNMYRTMYEQQQRDGCNARQPRALLLYGPPGCGKTMLALASATKCGLRAKVVAGPQLLDKYIGASEKAVRAVFEEAAASGKPTLLIFDEFEALAPRRGRDNTGVTDRVVNQFLTFLDGVEDTMGSRSGRENRQNPVASVPVEEEEEEQGCRGGQVFVIATTSRPDLIDPALLRPGRVEAHVYLGLPNAADREAILSVALKPLLGSDQCEQQAI